MNVSRAKNLVGNFSRPGDVVMNFCASVWSTAETCRLLAQHGTIAGCDVDSGLLTAAAADLVLASTSQLLGPKSNISGRAELKAPGKVFRKEKAAVLAHKKGSVWKATPGFDFLRVLPGHTLHFNPAIFEGYFSWRTYRHFALNMWSVVGRSPLYSMDPIALSKHECGPLGLSI